MKLDSPIFTDKEAAREHLEAQRWPNGPICPHCGNCDQTRITKMEGKAHRPGLYNCMECRQQFTVTVGSVFERSKIPLNKWLLATFLISSSKKGMSAHQLHRMLGVTYKTAWFMAHRIREAMKEDVKSSGPIGGEGKTICRWSRCQGSQITGPSSLRNVETDCALLLQRSYPARYLRCTRQTWLWRLDRE